ncbi:YaiI/YqxD family protein [Rhodopirellula sallentina]|nr:YaiI/YqxD family protein [Rhodopirellula sallentina]
MKIWIDADAAPTDVKTIIFRAAHRLNVETILVANQKISTPANAPTIRSVVVREGADQADRYIVKHGEKMQLAITADLPLANHLVEKGLLVIDPRGEEYSAANIASRLSMRNFMDSLRGSGMVTGGSAPYGDKDKKAFAATFDRLLHKAIRHFAKLNANDENV